MRREKGFTLIELMIVIAIIAIIAAIAIPGLLQAQRAANERNASASLKTMATAEIDFRSNDRDGNRMNDFWTGNVSGLFTIQTSPDNATWQPMGKFIDLSIAGADNFSADFVGQDRAVPGPAAWYYRARAQDVPTRGPKSGYWYYALESDASGAALEAYKGVTDGVGNGICHHTSVFGFGTYPDTFGSGRSLFLINEGATLIRYPLNGSVRPNALFPPNANPAGQGWVPAVSLVNWPNDTHIKLFSKLD